MQHTGPMYRFDCRRQEFTPYGLTCEVWTPDLMRRPDRHNEVELNYVPAGSIAYLFQDRRVVVPCGRLAVFWGLVPHQIVHYESDTPYYVCTIPFPCFWNGGFHQLLPMRCFAGVCCWMTKGVKVRSIMTSIC